MRSVQAGVKGLHRPLTRPYEDEISLAFARHALNRGFLGKTISVKIC